MDRCSKKLVQIIGYSLLLAAMSACTQNSNSEREAYMASWNGRFPTENPGIANSDEFASFKAAGYNGDGDAANAISTFYMKLDEDRKRECDWSAIAAENGNAAGQHNTGLCYEQKLGGRDSQLRAKFWYIKSAAQGNKYAKERLQSLVSKAITSDEDLKKLSVSKELQIFTASAYDGSIFAADALADFYKSNDDSSKICYWALIAAENDSPEMQYEVASCYSESGVWGYAPHRMKFWLEKAEKNGQSQARNAIDLLPKEVR
jgi:uncharacterized protein